MRTEERIRPWVVGGEAVCVVGIEGVIDAMGDDTITINGLALPTRLNRDRGIRYLSMTWPEGDETTCSREHCAGSCGNDAETEAEEALDVLHRMIRDEHDAHHANEPMVFCAHAICREVTA